MEMEINEKPSLSMNIVNAEDGIGMNIQTGGGGGTKDHSKLENLDYEHAGHTGFQQEAFLVTMEKESETVTSDKTISEIISAYNDGRTIKATYTDSESGVTATLNFLMAQDMSDFLLVQFNCFSDNGDDVLAFSIIGTNGGSEDNWQLIQRELVTEDVLSGYATKNDVKVEFAGETFDTNQEWANTLIEELNEAFGQVWEDLSDKYEKPSAGIPKWDLHPDVQESLNKADTALQEHQDISGKQNVVDNTLETYHNTIPTAINEVNSIAKGANQAISYANYSTMVSVVNSMGKDDLNVGQNIMIVTVEVPDLWVSGKENTEVTYIYTTDAQLISDLQTNGYIQVGYYRISMLETQKVDLTDYALKTDCNEIDLSSYSVGDNITDSALISAISNDRTIIKYNGVVYRYATTYGSGRIYTVMHTLTGGAYMTLNWTGSIYNLYEIGNAPWEIPSNKAQNLNNPTTDTYPSTYAMYNELQNYITTSNVDSALSSSSNNPVKNSALYKAVVGKEVNVQLYLSEWSEPSGTNFYNTVNIATLPAGTFTDNCTLELLNYEGFNFFAKHGFVLYGYEVSSQRIWITAHDKPTTNITLRMMVYNYE